jgi:serine/threonine protein kinase
VKEVRAHHHLRHPNIVQMMAVAFTPRTELGIVMWHEEHGDLGNFTRNFDVTTAWKIRMLHDVILGLNYLHTLEPPVIHGDIKLRNVLVGEGFVAKVTQQLASFHM